MPKIDLTNNVPGIDPMLTSLPNRLEAIGLPRVVGLDAAIASARWEMPTDDLDALADKVKDAKSPEQYANAVRALADAHAREDAISGAGTAAHRFRSTVTKANAGRVLSAFREALPGIYASIIEAYDAMGPEFQAEILAIKPESLGADTFALDANQKLHLDAAKALGDRLTDLVAVYNDAVRAAGGQRLTGDIPLEAEELACRLGDYPSLREWCNSADLLSAFAHDRGTYDSEFEQVHPESRVIRFSAFGPAAAVVLGGGTLALKTPKDAKNSLTRFRADREKTAVYTGTGEGRVPV